MFVDLEKTVNWWNDGSDAAAENQIPRIPFIQTHFTVCFGEQSDKIGRRNRRDRVTEVGDL